MNDLLNNMLEIQEKIKVIFEELDQGFEKNNID